ncbi:MAG: hypothetical protein IT462_07250 [Planctomycetes bacterium]|nr:hypothetical protein [Planctomycetota bacterium]
MGRHTDNSEIPFLGWWWGLAWPWRLLIAAIPLGYSGYRFIFHDVFWPYGWAVGAVLLVVEVVRLFARKKSDDEYNF